MGIVAGFLEVAGRIVVYHILPALILSFTSLMVVLGIIRLCQVKRPSTRGILLFVPLLKPLFVLIQGIFPASHRIYAPVSPGLQLPDPMNFIPAHLWRTDFQVVDVNMGISLILILVLVGLFLSWRWRSYYLFCHELSELSSLEKRKNQALWNTLARLREKISARARLLITRTEYGSPFSIGVRDPVIVLPSYILPGLTSKEKEAVLAHELVHIYQKDTIRQWIPVILKDLLVFSPFVHFSFAKISIEREKRADQAVARYLNDPIPLSSALLKIAKLMDRKKSLLPMTQSLLTRKFLKPGRVLTERVQELMNLSGKGKDRLPWAKRILIGIGIVLLLYPQIFIHIRVFPYTLQIF